MTVQPFQSNDHEAEMPRERSCSVIISIARAIRIGDSNSDMRRRSSPRLGPSSAVWVPTLACRFVAFAWSATIQCGAATAGLTLAPTDVRLALPAALQSQALIGPTIAAIENYLAGQDSGGVPGT
jgi:hypothetical protein